MESKFFESPFERYAENYDDWFESDVGQRLFAREVVCLRDLMKKPLGRWLEIGVGSGRFAQSLGITNGIDPAQAMLKIAHTRGVLSCRGVGENLPFPDSLFDGLLIAFSLCFLEDPVKTFQECRRVLKPGGSLIVGFIPADTPWGAGLMRKKEEGHRFYASARFYPRNQVLNWIEEVGFLPVDVRSALLAAPEDPIDQIEISRGDSEDAGFWAFSFTR